jgi:hypothetical protein
MLTLILNRLADHRSDLVPPHLLIPLQHPEGTRHPNRCGELRYMICAPSPSYSSPAPRGYPLFESLRRVKVWGEEWLGAVILRLMFVSWFLRLPVSGSLIVEDCLFLVSWLLYLVFPFLKARNLCFIMIICDYAI